MNPGIDPNVPTWRLTVGEFTELVKSLQQPVPKPELGIEQVFMNYGVNPHEIWDN